MAALRDGNVGHGLVPRGYGIVPRRRALHGRGIEMSSEAGAGQGKARQREVLAWHPKALPRTGTALLYFEPASAWQCRAPYRNGMAQHDLAQFSQGIASFSPVLAKALRSRAEALHPLAEARLRAALFRKGIVQ